jgi:glycosyltransferase involved in cell wall biosynthesis
MRWSPYDRRMSDTAAVVPAKDEERRVGATVRAAREIKGVELVVVVDDGSTDGTALAAERAGALVLRHPRNRGKGAAMETGAAAVRAVELREGRADAPWYLLFLDADLEASAAGAAPLVEPVRAGDADMTVAVLPRQQQPGAARPGGHGFVVRLSRNGIRKATGFTATQPLSGQRCLSREAFEAARPLAHGFGVETAMTIDLLRQGFRVQEVECELHHRVTGTDWRAQVHRGRQYAHVAAALAARRLPEGVRRRARA